MNENDMINSYMDNQKAAPERKLKVAIFPSLEKLYATQENARKNAAKYGLTSPHESKSPAELHFDKNVVNDSKSPVLKVESPSRMLQEDLGLIKFQKAGNGYRKVAKFLLLLGKDDAAKILRQFNEEEIVAITAELATIHRVEKAEATQLVEEFNFIKTRQQLPQGGVDVARNILVNAFGEKVGREKLLKSVPEKVEEKPFEFLADIDIAQLMFLLKPESILVIASIIPFLPQDKAVSLFKSLDNVTKVEVAKRISRRNKLDPESMKIVSVTLKEKLRQQGKVVTEEKDGKEALANILKYMDIDAEQAILGELELESVALSAAVKEKLFTIDMITNIDDTDFQKILVSYEDKDLAIILKGKAKEIEHKILSNVSQNRAAIILQEKGFLGVMKRSDVEESTKLFLSNLRRMHLLGQIVLRNPNEEWI